MGFFDKVFKPKEQKPQGIGFIEKIGEKKYRLGKSIITGLVNATENQILNYRWEESELKWLLDCEFEGGLDLNLREGVLNAFYGVWKSGVFRGETFSGSSTASFEGGEFGVAGNIKPEFVPDYDKWKISPFYFADGVFSDETEEGILGIKNFEDNEVLIEGNILGLTKGQSMLIESSEDFVIVNCINRLGDDNILQRMENVGWKNVEEDVQKSTNDINYEIVSGNKKDNVYYAQNITHLLKWSQMRGCSIEEFGEHTEFAVGKKYSNKLFHVSFEKEVDNIKLIRKKEFKFIPNLQDSVMINDINVGLKIPIIEEYSKFKETLQTDFENGNFESKLSEVQKLVELNLIDGYAKFKSLRFLFNEAGSITEPVTEQDKKSLELLAYLSDIKKIIVDNIENKDQREQTLEYIKNRILGNVSLDTSKLADDQKININFTKDPRIGVSATISFSALTSDEKENLMSFKESIETGNFYNDLLKIKKLVLNNYIEGYYNRPELAVLFDEKGNEEPTDEDAKDAMVGLSYIMLNIIPKIEDKNIATALTSVIKMTING